MKFIDAYIQEINNQEGSASQQILRQVQLQHWRLRQDANTACRGYPCPWWMPRVGTCSITQVAVKRYQGPVYDNIGQRRRESRGRCRRVQKGESTIWQNGITVYVITDHEVS